MLVFCSFVFLSSDDSQRDETRIYSTTNPDNPKLKSPKQQIIGDIGQMDATGAFRSSYSNAASAGNNNEYDGCSALSHFVAVRGEAEIQTTKRHSEIQRRSRAVMSKPQKCPMCSLYVRLRNTYVVKSRQQRAKRQRGRSSPVHDRQEGRMPGAAICTLSAL